MPENDRVVLNTILERTNQEIASELTSDQYFEFFSADQILKKFDLSNDEVMSGIVGGSHDGGIDSIHFFVNGTLVEEDTDLSKLGKDIAFDIHITQAKQETGFSESAIQKFHTTTGDIFNLSNTLVDFTEVYNEQLLGIVEKFRNAYTRNAQKFPNLKINFYYITKGDEPHPNVKRLVGNLKKLVSSLFSSAQFNFTFLGAAQLLSLARQTPSIPHNIKLAENPISCGEQSFVCLVNIVDFFNFICDSEGKLQKRLFESNVRDFQGDVQVNQGIQQSLTNSFGDDFWWLNNGITLIASKASLSGKILTIEKPQIVNGMQTSSKIHNHFSSISDPSDTRNILVRVIGLKETAEGDSTRNRIIQATNSQTRIPIASLRATDPIHHSIEEYIKSFGYYYDRRKNYYKNEKKPFNKIISITYLAQGVMSILLKRPNDARARPSTLLKEDENYNSVFNNVYPMQIYPTIITIIKRIESYLRETYSLMSSTERNNYKFHLAMFSSLLAVNNPNATAQEIIDLDIESLNDDFLNMCYEEVDAIFNKSKIGRYGASKSKEVVSTLNERLIEITYTGK